MFIKLLTLLRVKETLNNAITPFILFSVMDDEWNWFKVWCKEISSCVLVHVVTRCGFLGDCVGADGGAGGGADGSADGSAFYIQEQSELVVDGVVFDSVTINKLVSKCCRNITTIVRRIAGPLYPNTIQTNMPIIKKYKLTPIHEYNRKFYFIFNYFDDPTTDCLTSENDEEVIRMDADASASEWFVGYTFYY
jgi:hypothetical protein